MIKKIALIFSFIFFGSRSVFFLSTKILQLDLGHPVHHINISNPIIVLE